MSPSSSRSNKRAAATIANSATGSTSTSGRPPRTRSTTSPSQSRQKRGPQGKPTTQSTQSHSTPDSDTTIGGSGSDQNPGGSKRRSTGNQSIVELWSSQRTSFAGDSDSSDGPRPAKRRNIKQTSAFEGGSQNTVQRSGSDPIATVHTSFAEMYTFKTKHAAAQQTGLVDLTKPSPPRPGMYNGIHKSSFNPHQGPKKMVVKTLRPATSSRPEKTVLLEQKWATLDAALERLFSRQDSKLLLEELYAGGEFLCREGEPKELYAKLKAKCTNHLDKRLRASLDVTATSSTPARTLQAFVDTWGLWQQQLQSIRHVFFYLNQTHLVRSAEEPVLDIMGLQIFRNIVFNSSNIQGQVIQGAIDLINQDRKEQSRPEIRALAKQAIAVFHDLGVYTSDFETLFVNASETFFESWRNSDAQSADLSHYLRSCSELLDREMTRCDSLGMDRTTKAMLSDLFDTIMIENNLALITEGDALLDLFKKDLTNEIEKAYTLLKRKDQQQLLSPTFANFIEMEGTLIVFDEKHDSEMVVRLLRFKKKLDHISKFSFHKNESLDNTLHKAFEIFMNKTKKSQSTWDTDNAKPGEMIAKHVDLLLKGGPRAVPGLRKDDKAEEEQDFDNEGNDDKEVEQHLDDALDLFRFVHGKAVFEAFYKKDLARRLLMGRTQSFDAERSMLTRLRNECGAGFTHNLESMFKDMDLAREEMKSYSQLLSDRGTRSNPDLSVNVLSMAAWPTYPDVSVKLPQSVSKAQADFERHYKEKHVGRRLHWKSTLSHCQLKSNFPKGKKEIVVSGFQAVVLLLFNDVSASESLSYDQIQAATGLPENELVRTLQSLACAKYRVLTKTPKGRDINPATDTFTFNAAFVDPKYRIKINQIQLKETKEENKETHQRVAADRHYETQAAIVRIMKSRKVIGHNELIVEVIKATRSRGVLDQSDIKRNIEKLIEKEYMERDDEVKNGYRYLA